MSKYDALRAFLEKQRAERVPMTFADVERVLGFKLPKSQSYPAWWSNNPSNNVMTRAWLAAGYKTEQVDIEGRKLVFRRVPKEFGRPATLQPSGFGKDAPAVPSRNVTRHPIFGVLKDVTWMAPDTDLTQPADPEWAERVEDRDWGRLPE
jgi:hypothetical protein